MDLQQMLQTAQEESTAIQEKYQKEQISLIDQNNQLSETLRSFRQTIDLATTEAAEAKSKINEYTEVISEMERKEKQLMTELTETRTELEEARKRVMDPTVINDYEAKLAELTGERKHWQKKAQSLSKDMQRMIQTSSDVAQLKEENGRLVHRIEELIAERTAFREAMQQTMADVSPASASKGPTPRKGGVGSLFKKTER